MSTEIKVPVLPESIADATIVTWHKKVGEPVKRDENLVDLETDKVVLEVPAPQDGVLESILIGEGEKVTAQQVIAMFKAGAVAAPTAKAEKASVPAEVKSTAKTASDVLTPSVRRAVGEHEVDPSQIKGTGKGGRITKDDVQTHLTSGSQSSVNTMVIAGERVEKRVPMSRLRARIAERLLSAQHNAAMLTTFNEVNLKAVMDLRTKYKDAFEKNHGVKLGFMSFFTKAAIEALKRFPAVNASIDKNDMVYHGYYDIGIAVSTERGLVVPVLRNADQMSMPDIEKAISEYADKARKGTLSIEEITGGTFTITNGGIFGSLLSTPILNPPQSAILGMHKIEERAIVENGQIVARPMMYLAMSYDHRVIDGRESVSFLRTIKELLEEPARLLLDV